MAKMNYMMTAEDIAKELNCSKSHAYKLLRMMNEELAKQGYITMAGKVPKGCQGQCKQEKKKRIQNKKRGSGF